MNTRSNHTDILIILLLVVLIFSVTDYVYNPEYFWTVIGIRSLLLVILQVVAGRAFYMKVIKNGALKESAKSKAFAGYALFAVFFLFELVFMFYPKSHHVGTHLSHQVWKAYYDKPINKIGLRDREIDLMELNTKTTVMVIGDSFTYGAGIKDHRDRFTDVLQDLLGEEYRVINFSKGGNETIIEAHNYMQLKIKPDIAVLQYYGNDIELAARMAGKELQTAKRMPPVIKHLITRSFLLDFIYAHLPKNFEGYDESITGLYNDPELLKRHLQDLKNLVSLLGQGDTEVIQLTFPYLTDLKASRVFIDPVMGLMNSMGVVSIDVSPLIADLEPAERIVHGLDPHPSIEVHKRVAEKLYTVIKEVEGGR